MRCALDHLPFPFLFPSLQVLTWFVSPGREDRYLTINMHRLLPAGLASLSVKIFCANRADLFLQNYITFCPRLKLKSVNFDIYQPSPNGARISLSEIHQLSQAICLHNHLDSLELSIPIDHVALRQVMLSVRLRSASLVLHPTESNLRNIGITSTDIPFCNVKDLELLVWDLRFVSSLLRPRDQMFHSFRLRLDTLREARDVFSFLTALASPQRTHSLQSVHLTFGNLYADSRERFNIPYDNALHCLTYGVLQPLTSLEHLRDLRLLSNQTFLTDEQLKSLVCSWPMLEVL